MRPRLAPALLALALALDGPPAVLANVFGDGDPANGVEDDRRPPAAAEAGLAAAVGMVGSDGYLGSAVLLDIDPINPDRRFDLVVSAAHVFFDAQGRFTSPDGHFFFYPEGPDGPGGRAIPITALAVGSSRPSQNHDQDWAVAVLARRLDPGAARLGFSNPDEPAIARDLAAGARFLSVGFARDAAGRFARSVTDHCAPLPAAAFSPFRRLAGVLLHDCDTLAGFSGGPNILVEPEGSAYVVAVMSAEANASPAGARFDPAVNPNLSVRITGRFLRTILAMARTGQAP